MAVEVGVTHKPDVSMHTFQPEDQYMIMASDGVWELISSQVSHLLWRFSGIFLILIICKQLGSCLETMYSCKPCVSAL